MIKQTTHRISAVFILALVGLVQPSDSRADNIGVTVPPGFEVSLYADDALAHDIHSMTIDSQGRVVVAGPGFIRILIDEDNDGKAESFQQFADAPPAGIQGMYFLGNHLLCTGGNGLIRYKDNNHDDKADGPPDLFLKVVTGVEHGAHAIQKGPDGWWYLIAGNSSNINATYANLPSSAVTLPRAGTLLRLKPDLSGGEVYAHGLRNAYDFAFDSIGNIFTCDSDGERDVSLPWYLPARIFQLLPGSDAGWVSRSWKKPSYFPESAPKLADIGRASPTGVVCYQHTQFPKEFQNVLFVLDWTFGRVLSVPKTLKGDLWTGTPTDFMTGKGQFGFAPTDAAVGPDGSLFVSIGGRGTRGGVFRVTYPQRKPTNFLQHAQQRIQTPVDQRLKICLTAPQPLSSWSRTVWVQWAKEIGPAPFLAAAKDQTRPPAERIRAIEILTELAGGLDDATFQAIVWAKSPEVRARAAWSLGSTAYRPTHFKWLLQFLRDDQPTVALAALESTLSIPPQISKIELLPQLASNLNSPHPRVRQLAGNIAARLTPTERNTLKQLAITKGPQAELAFRLGVVSNMPPVDNETIQFALSRIVEPSAGGIQRLEAIRLLQRTLGDMGPSKYTRPAVFDGYASAINLAPHERSLDASRAPLAKLYPTGDETFDSELLRLLSMLTIYNANLLDAVLSQISETSDPTRDIECLIATSRIPVERNSAQSLAIAKAFVHLSSKIKQADKKIDRNWEPRLGEVYKEHAKIDPGLAVSITQQPGFGEPEHVLFLSDLPAEHLETALALFAARIQEADDYPWSNNIVFALGESKNNAYRELIREQFETFAVRGAVLKVLTTNPEEIDRRRFIEGLQSSQLDILRSCLKALSSLQPANEPDELIALWQTMRRLGTEKLEFLIRQEIVKLLQRTTKTDFGFQFCERGHRQQPEVTRQIANWIMENHPDAWAEQATNNMAEKEQLKQRLAAVDWTLGDVGRGEKLFKTRACSRCHGGRRAVGPALAGVTTRFSRDDLFTAIALPSQDVSPRYQTTAIETTEGKILTGLIIYESVDGLILRDGNDQTYRIEADQIESRSVMATSLMPNGLLKDLKPGDLADIYSYLSSLKK